MTPKTYKVCGWCATVQELDQNGAPGMCRHCAAAGHLYRLLDDGIYGIAWLRQRYQERGDNNALARLAKAEAAYRAALTVTE